MNDLSYKTELQTTLESRISNSVVVHTLSMNEFPVCSVQKQEKAISKSVPTGHENCHYYGIYRTIKVWRYVTKNMQVRLTALYIENFTL